MIHRPSGGGGRGGRWAAHWNANFAGKLKLGRFLCLSAVNLA